MIHRRPQEGKELLHEVQTNVGRDARRQQVVAPYIVSGALGGDPQEGLLAVSTVPALGGTPRNQTSGDGRGAYHAHHRLHTMLKTGRSYHELGGEYLERFNRDQLQRYLGDDYKGLGLQ